MADFVPIEHQIVIRSLLGGFYGGATADRLAAATREMFFPAGKVIYDGGDAPRFLYFILHGEVELSGEGLDPWSLSGRGVFGILDAELERPHARTAKAVTDVRVIAMRTESWHDIVEDTFDYTKMRISRNSADLIRRGLEVAPHAGFLDWPVNYRAEDVPPPTKNHEENPFARLLVLHLADVFAKAGIQALTRIATFAEERELVTDEVLVKEGDPMDTIFIVGRGLLEMTREDPEVAVEFGVNRLVGGYAGMGQEVWSFTITAREPTCVIAINYEDLFDVMEDHFDVVRSVMSFLTIERDRLQTFNW